MEVVDVVVTRPRRFDWRSKSVHICWANGRILGFVSAIQFFASLLFHHPLLSDPFGPVIGGPSMGHTHVSASRLEGPMHRSCGTLVFYETGLL